MTSDELKILETFKKIIPKLTERQKDWFIGFAEGMVFGTESEASNLVQMQENK